LAVEVELFECLDAVEADADGALDAARQAYPYDNIAWLKLTRAHVLPGAEPLVARARDEAGRCAWLFLMQSVPRKAEAFARWYTLAYRPIFNFEPGERAMPLLRGIGDAFRGRLDTIALAPLDAASAELLRKGLGWRARQAQAGSNWVAHTRGLTFEDYWEKRPGRLRNTARRKAKQAGLEIRILRHFEPEAWSDFEAVYQASWKPAEGSPEFLRAMAEAWGAGGALRLGIASRSGRAVAAQLWTIDGAAATIHKLAHDEREKAGSPGTVLTEAMFRQVIEEDRPALIDFGTGDDAYKADWMDERRPLYRLDLANAGTIGGRLAAIRWTMSALVRGRRNG
jgi:hypothetical protein